MKTGYTRDAFGRQIRTLLVDPEVNTIYENQEDRWVVSLVVSYSEKDLSWVDKGSDFAAMAIKAALDLTRDEGSSGTNWWVYDRKTGRGRFYVQNEVDPDQYV